MDFSSKIDADAAPVRTRPRTAWVAGTSVSIESGGFVTHLANDAKAGGWALSNLSVGDQTSMMGWMRLMQHAASMARGDVVVWEYSLLDHLLRGMFPVEEVRAARRLAWMEIARRGAGLVVAMTPPRSDVDAPNATEQECVADATALGAAVVDLRQVAATLGIRGLAECYRDDRHPSADLPLLPAYAAAVFSACSRARPLELPTWADLPAWQWVDAETLGVGRPAKTFSNALVEVAAVELDVDDWLPLPVGSHVVAAGIISSHGSGALWCGHPGCPPASTKLPQELPYRFLLRASGMACRQPPPDRIACAPDWAFGCGQWRDYGQEQCSTSARIALFGIVLSCRAPAQRPARSLAVRVLGRLRRLGARIALRRRPR